MSGKRRTIRLAGETDAGSAGTQPARDSRPGPRRHVERAAPLANASGAAHPLARALPPQPACQRGSLMPPKIHRPNTSSPRAFRPGCLLSEPADCPIQAEPVQIHHEEKEIDFAPSSRRRHARGRYRNRKFANMAQRVRLRCNREWTTHQGASAMPVSRTRLEGQVPCRADSSGSEGCGYGSYLD